MNTSFGLISKFEFVKLKVTKLKFKFRSFIYHIIYNLLK